MRRGLAIGEYVIPVNDCITLSCVVVCLLEDLVQYLMVI